MVKTKGTLLVAALWAAVNLCAEAQEDVQEYSITAALVGDESSAHAAEVRFYFGKQPYPEPSAKLGTFRTSKSTHLADKSVAEACNGAFVAAMTALEERALREGGNAVVEIKSNYDNVLTESNTSFKCGAGKIMAAVALEGRVVRLPILPVAGNAR